MDAEDKLKLGILRDHLFENLPTGELDPFELIRVVKMHIDELDKLIDDNSEEKSEHENN